MKKSIFLCILFAILSAITTPDNPQPTIKQLGIYLLYLYLYLSFKLFRYKFK